jgi:uncharacterized 2Fe-2S/4Fe-4S cluster protein (DUF4445 family)
MDHFRVTFRPDNKSIVIHAGATVFEAAADADIILNATCGGEGICGKCLVRLLPEGKDVLACQYRIETDLDVIVPVSSRFFEQKILEHGTDRNLELSPVISKKFVDNKTVVYRNHTAIAYEAGDTTKAVYGVAVDIGTTTVVAKLVDLTDGQVKATAVSGNPQIAFGDDVISRIAYGQAEEGLGELHDVIVYCINMLVKQLCVQAGVAAEHVYEVTIAGNTTMNHIFLKLPVKQLGQAPYSAFSVDSFDRTADQARIKINPAGNIHTIENIAGFVGSDTVAVAVAVAMDEAEKMTLVVDIGTNGEIILGTKDRMYAASCAAGPALEGARISQGSRAIDGAIERVVLNTDDIDLDVIGGKTPRTICGSGLIDALAVLVELAIVDSTGRFGNPSSLGGRLPSKILKRVIEQADGQYGFVLAHNSDLSEKPVILTQKDIRETQLAKAAIRAGIKLLQRKFGIGDSAIEQILLAGAFGNYIRPKSARMIGLLPNVPLERIHFVGNAASSGAQMILTSRMCRKAAPKLARQIEYVEIAHEPDFLTEYAESMLFEPIAGSECP